MADLSINFAGIKAPNPFWLASAPPTDKAYNVVRAYEAGWGGVVWGITAGALVYATHQRPLATPDYSGADAFFLVRAFCGDRRTGKRRA